MAQSSDASFERCCRLCAEEQDVTIMIFSKEAEALLLQNKLNKYLLIEVAEDDTLPKNICIRCCYKLQSVCDFIDTAHKAQETLLRRSTMLNKTPTTCMPVIDPNSIKTEITDTTEKSEEAKITEMEVSVDPMMILQNEDMLSPTTDETCENAVDVTYLHGVACEDVTIKLIRKGSDSKSNDPVLEDKKPFPCLTCKRSFLTELALKNHSWTHSNEEKPVKMYLCNTCDEGFDLKNDLIGHLKQHRRNGFCTVCGRTFRTEKNLEAHMAVHLSSSKSFTCKVCGRSYNTLSNLRTHSITHSNERPYHCHLCKKCFKRKQDLKFHINQHTGAKPYKCPFCDKCFASSGNCYSHRNRMHPGRRLEYKLNRRPGSTRENQSKNKDKLPTVRLTNVKGIFKYFCQICGHSFMKRDNYTYHMYQHTGEKPFTCSFCPEKFVTRRGLLFHHNKDHPTNELEPC
ncbi:gastrula zinc finger protein XlCGF46.1-like isoform X3 [Hyposmocoma kahamanoa]|uniref:gastrula zinc finger protein XlCGF46.1-like isoform X3 n=1 Tax=Hyposmocoma kahamanoa TaxID=1477025 RepID=UPI000E6DA102|nr:gastrula zinc finger protein XlCGF46.1-like isoform X3 [Hyposmocoma kahamanoa]